MEVSAGPGTGSSSTTIDASNTAEVFIQVLTPGVMFQSASGASYDQSEVPEPSTLSFVVIGLSGSCWENRKRASDDSDER